MPQSEPVSRAWIARVDDVNPRDRSLVATINTNALDRYRTCIDPRGIDCRRYMENRVVLWEHGMDPTRGSMPIGRNDWVRPIIGPDGPMLRAKTCFHERGRKGDEFCERLYECYKDGDMRAWSVNVIPKPEGCSAPTREEIRERPELVDCWMMYRSSELGEYSAVAVGGNAEALTADEGRSVLKCVSRGLSLPANLVEKARRAVAAADPAAIARRIGRDGPKYLALAADGTELGRYDSEDEAKARVAAAIAAEPAGQPEPEPEAEPPLPPLGGRSYAEAQAERLEAFNRNLERRLADQAREFREHRDFARGRA